MLKTIIVAGTTRSGLTLTMQILDLGGYPCFGEYPAYENYEFKKLPWYDALGKAIKVVDTNGQLPPKGDYHVICLRRDYEQQAKSFIKFVYQFRKDISPNKMLPVIKKSIRKDRIIIEKWARKQISMVTINFEDLIKNPLQCIKRINNSFDLNLSEKAVNCVIPRSTDCYEGMLEYKLLELNKNK